MAGAIRMNYNISSSPVLLVLFLAISMSCNYLAYAKDYTGTAAYYVPDNSTACKKGLWEAAGDMVAMVPNSTFKKGKACGNKYQVTCTGGTNNYPSPCKPGQQPVTVTVANSCSGDDCATFTLSTAAFEVIAKHDAGRVNISYKRIK
ncbi:EG45-like domain containing protein [Linum grandiflorum]